MPCDPNTLLNDARCFTCLTEDQRAIINLSLLCQIAAGGPPTPVGPNAWFDIESLEDSDDTMFLGTPGMGWSPISLPDAGTLTQFRIYVFAIFGVTGVKMALYSSDGLTLIADGTGSVGPGDGSQYLEFNADAPVLVPAGNYLLAFIVNTGDLATRYLTGSGAYNFEGAQSYAGFPPAVVPAPAGTVARNITIGVFLA